MPERALNRSLLLERHPHLASALDHQADISRVRVCATEHGFSNMMLEANDGEDRCLYHPQDLWRQVESDLEGRRFRAEDATLLMGLGLGYHAEAIARRMEMDHRLFVVEPCPEVLQAALAHGDLGPLLSDDRVHLFVGPELVGLYDALEHHLLRMVAGTLHELTLNGLRQAFPDAYSEAEDRVEKIRRHLELSFRFNIKNEGLLENILENAPLLEGCGDTAALREMLKGTPAVVIAGGPSLSRNIEALGEAKGKTCLISVDTALKPLLDQGIQPDLVVSSDGFPQNARKMEGLPRDLRIPLLFDVGVHRAIPPCFRGPRFVLCSQNALSSWLIGLMGYQGSLGRSTSSAHLAFHAARWMGADPVVFTGLDLAFPDGDHHVQGAAFTWKPSEHQTFVEVPDVCGGTVRTLPSFRAMIGLFEREISAGQVRCIDATEGGARIRGTEIAGLADVIRAFRSQPPLFLEKRIREAYRGPSSRQVSLLRQGLLRLQDEIRNASSLAQEALPLLSRARGLLAEGGPLKPGFQETAARILELDRELGKLSLFEEVMIDFRPELLAFQFLQGYRIQRTAEQVESLDLTLESLEHAFRDAGHWSGIMQKGLDVREMAPLQDRPFTSAGPNGELQRS